MKGSTNDAVSEPAATPPLSKAIPSNNSGVNIDKIIISITIGAHIHIKSIAKSALMTIINIASATPIDRPIIIDFLDITPSVISSTCLFSTWTAGSAKTIVKPIISPNGISNHFVFPLAIDRPRTLAVGK